MEPKKQRNKEKKWKGTKTKKNHPFWMAISKDPIIQRLLWCQWRLHGNPRRLHGNLRPLESLEQRGIPPIQSVNALLQSSRGSSSPTLARENHLEMSFNPASHCRLRRECASVVAIKILLGFFQEFSRVFVNPAALEAPIQHATGKGERSPFRVFDFDGYDSDGAEEAESDEFYELTPEDYARLVSKKREERFLKTAKIRDAEAAARISKFAKMVFWISLFSGTQVHWPAYEHTVVECKYLIGRVFQGGYIDVDGEVIDHGGTVNLQMLPATNIIDMYA
ncbi:hypothetical protein SELMODRAFT_404525 [Selaginella moellendorffii]|uniref:Uncharacterized protein n=1 Tax=Selaginella moellendorffii TaxID=88036 RepID=D8QVM0_SELML|nr:hypothetical protein SELMODRAFT_404525 [Selaginella moellendorffii]